MSIIQVIGIGSPFGDDQAGWKVANILRHNETFQASIQKHLQFEILDRPGIGLLQSINKDATTIIIDALKSRSDIGKLHRYENPHIDAPEILLSTHGLGIIQALQLGAVLGELPKQIILYGIEIGEVMFDTQLSQPIQKAILELAEVVAKELQKLLKIEE